LIQRKLDHRHELDSNEGPLVLNSGPSRAREEWGVFGKT
jgi:hypothetical protein